MSVRGFKCRLNIILAERGDGKGEFAERIGVTKGTLSQITNSKSLPSFEVTYAILKELEMGIEEVWVKIEEK